MRCLVPDSTVSPALGAVSNLSKSYIQTEIADATAENFLVSLVLNLVLGILFFFPIKTAVKELSPPL